MKEASTLEKILSIGFLVAILGINITLLLLSFNSRQQRDDLRMKSDQILCVLLISPDERVVNGKPSDRVDGCYK